MEHRPSATKMLALPLYHSWLPLPETAQNIPMRSISISKKYQTIGLKITTKKTTFRFQFSSMNVTQAMRTIKLVKYAYQENIFKMTVSV
jgi:hypothetical protein